MKTITLLNQITSFRMLKINYLILAHKNLSQLKRLIWRLSTDNPADFSIYVHLDKKWEITPEEIKSIEAVDSRVTVIPMRISCKLDDWSLIEAELNLAEFAYKKGPQDAYYVMMSGQDYPIKSNAMFADYCKNQYPKPLIDVTPWSPDNWVHLKFMNSPLYHTLYQIKVQNKTFDFALRAFRRGIDNLIPKKYKMKRRLEKMGVASFGGSQWWVLPDSAIKEILELYHSNEMLMKTYNKTLTPEETFFQTMVMRTSVAKCVDVNLPEQITQNCPTFAYFNPDGKKFTGHPYIIDSNVWPLIKNSEYYFARKFDTELSPSVFDEIDEDIYGHK